MTNFLPSPGDRVRPPARRARARRRGDRTEGTRRAAERRHEGRPQGGVTAIVTAVPHLPEAHVNDFDTLDLATFFVLMFALLALTGRL